MWALQSNLPIDYRIRAHTCKINTIVFNYKYLNIIVEMITVIISTNILLFFMLRAWQLKPLSPCCFLLVYKKCRLYIVIHIRYSQKYSFLAGYASQISSEMTVIRKYTLFYLQRYVSRSPLSSHLCLNTQVVISCILLLLYHAFDCNCSVLAYVVRAVEDTIMTTSLLYT